MSSAFKAAVAVVLRLEGGYVNDPRDPGGETNMGISKRSYPNEDLVNLTLERAREIYKKDYWDRIRGDELPVRLALAVFDCAVNQGVPVAIRLLQITLQVEVDGELGPLTLTAAHRAGPDLAWRYLLQRAKRYLQTRNVELYGPGWGARLVEIGETFNPKEGL